MTRADLHTLGLFEDEAGTVEPIGPRACVLRGFARDAAPDLLAAITSIAEQAPFRHMQVPGGHTMSVAMTNCGRFGWTSDARGYRYTPDDPLSGAPWPPLPAVFLDLAQAAAQAAGFSGFVPDACLINRYRPGTRLTLHQDRNEHDLAAPIVSVSLGMPATFVFGGLRRADRTRRVPLRHGDVTVWGDEDRLRYHGVLPLADAPHPLLGSERLNLTLRKAGP